jgi:hypothetical protein
MILEPRSKVRVQDNAIIQVRKLGAGYAFLDRLDDEPSSSADGLVASKRMILTSTQHTSFASLQTL